jgi:hypothetical protein
MAINCYHKENLIKFVMKKDNYTLWHTAMLRIIFLILISQALFAQVNIRFNSWVPAIPSATDLTGTVYVPIVQNGVSKKAIPSLFTTGTTITNSALNNELMMSNGTNAVSSGLFADANGNLNMGTGKGLSSRTIAALGTSSNLDLIFQNKGGGSTFYFNTTAGSAIIQAGGSATLLNLYGLTGINLSSGTLSSGYRNLTIQTDASNATITTSASTNLEISPNGRVDITGTQTNTPVTLSLTGATNNWAIGDGVIFQVTETGGYTVTGIAGGYNGRIIYIVNRDGVNSIAFSYEDASSSAANRMHLTPGATVTLTHDRTLMLIYDGASQRWRDCFY